MEKGEPAGAVFELKPGENTLGRSRAATFQLASPDVSGQHARILVKDGVARLENLSQFGTRLDDAPVTGLVALASGQRLAIGKSTVLRFTQDPEATRPGSSGATERTLAEQEADTGKGLSRTMAAPATRAATVGATRAAGLDVTRANPQAESDNELTGAFTHSDVTSAAGGTEEGATRAMQTRAATPEEIEHLKLNEQKRVQRRMMIGVALGIPILILVLVFRPRTPPPETEIEWAKSASGEYLDAYAPAPSGGLKEGGYDLLYPGNKTFKKAVVAGGVVFEGWIGRDQNVPMRVSLQEENEVRLATLSRTEVVDDWMRQMSASGGKWNFDRPSPIVNFFGTKNGVPYTLVTYLRDGEGSWFGVACVVRHGSRRMVTRAEVPASERVRAEKMLAGKLLRVSDEFEYAHWEYTPVTATLSEADALSQARKDLERTAPATWVALEEQLTGLLTKAVQSGNKEIEDEAVRLLIKLREREALWFNSQQLAFDAARMQGNDKKALKIAEFTKAVFSNVDDQRYYTVRKWKVGF
jgi:hypothetical protein